MVNPVAWGINKIKKLNEYIWHTPLSELSRRKLLLIKQIRIVVLAARGFLNDDVQLRASALTFYTLLSVIPVAAIAFALAKGFGLDQTLQQLIIEKTNLQDKDLDPSSCINCPECSSADKRRIYCRHWNHNFILVCDVVVKSDRRVLLIISGRYEVHVHGTENLLIILQLC